MRLMSTMQRVPVDHLSTVGIWLATEDATVDNVSFVLTILPPRWSCQSLLRAPDGGFPEGKPSWDVSKDEGLLPVSGARSCFCIGNVQHGSKREQLQTSRHAYSMHVAEGAPGYQWLPEIGCSARRSIPSKNSHD
jgi:hypothetical protein